MIDMINITILGRGNEVWGKSCTKRPQTWYLIYYIIKNYLVNDSEKPVYPIFKGRKKYF